MNALPYLFITKLKNRFRELLRKPAQLIYLVFMVGMVAMVLWSGNMEEAQASKPGDPRILSGIITAYYTLMFVLTEKSGFSRGGALFSLPDVNLIFTAPFKPSRVLFFGISNQLGTSLLMGLLILFQYAWINQNYGITAAGMAVLILGYAAIMFSAQLFSMIVYSFTSGKDKLRNLLKSLFYGVLIAYGAGIAIYSYLGSNGDTAIMLERLLNAVSSTAVKLLPFGGWFGGIFFDYYTGASAFLPIGLLLFFLFFVGSILAVIFFKHDYYEDVLKTAEYNYSAIVAKKEGKTQEAVPENVKVGKTGFTAGEGASAFYYKHQIENRRAKRFILSPLEIVFMVIVIGFSFIMKNLMGEMIVILALGFGTYMQIFTSALGRLPKEFAKPYIYLVPESSFNKLFNSIRDTFPGILVEAVVTFTAVGLLAKVGPLEILMAILARISFSLLFLALNIVSQRIFGSGSSKAYTMMFYILLLLVMIAPGVVLSIIAGITGLIAVSLQFTLCLCLFVSNIFVFALSLFLCRNMLQYAEINN